MFKTIKEEENDLLIEISGLSLSIVNSLRRVLMSDISNYAFDEIDIKENTTIFHNEFIEHRIGLIPIIMGGQMTFRLSIKNNDKNDRWVLSDDLVTIDEMEGYEIMKGIPILILREGEEIEIHAKASKGKGSDNIKYSVIETVNFVQVKQLEEGEYPEEILEYMYGDRMYYGRKYLLTKHNILYKDVKEKYCMMLRTIMMEPRKVMRMGIIELRRRLLEMRDIDIEEIKEHHNYYNFRIHGIDYIEANILVSQLLERDDIKIVTSTKKHFLDKFFEFKIETKTEEKISLLRIKEDEIEKVIKVIDNISKE